MCIIAGATKITLYVRKAVTVLALLASVRQLPCISTGHLACVFTSEWKRAMARVQALLSSHPCIFIANILSGVVWICSNPAISQTVLRSGLSQQLMLGSVLNRHLWCYCTIKDKNNSGKQIKTAVLPASEPEISLYPILFTLFLL